MEVLYNMMLLQFLEIHENIVHLNCLSIYVYHLIQIVDYTNLLGSVLVLYYKSK